MSTTDETLASTTRERSTPHRCRSGFIEAVPHCGKKKISYLRLNGYSMLVAKQNVRLWNTFPDNYPDISNYFLIRWLGNPDEL